MQHRNFLTREWRHNLNRPSREFPLAGPVAQFLNLDAFDYYLNMRTEKEQGDAPDFRARLADDQRSGRPETVQQRIAPLLRPVLDRNPHEFGYCSPRWTIALLARYLWGAHHVTASPRSVHLALERLREPQDSASLAP